MKIDKTIQLPLIVILLLFTACKKDNIDRTGTRYTNNKNIEVYISTAEWYLTRNKMGGGDVNLKLSGSTNADKIAIRTSGDGALSDNDLILSSSKFNEDRVVSFTATAIPASSFKQFTVLVAKKGNDVFEVKIESGDLKY